jgi:nucleotide-binding universal stress UspA family protein
MKLLILLDGSGFAESILEPASELANRAGAEVYLMEVVKPSEAHATWRKLPPVGGDLTPVPYSTGVTAMSVAPREGVAAETKVQAEERAVQEAEEYLARIAGRFFPDQAIPQVTSAEEPVGAIIEYARQQHFDLIALATHGRTGLPRLLMGSVASSLLEAHVAPLFLVRPDGLGD